MTLINNNYNLANYNITPVPAFRQGAVSGLYRGNNLPGTTTFTSLAESMGTACELEAAAKSNPRIQMLASKYNIPIKVNEKAFNELKNGHLKECRVVAAKIASHLPEELRADVDMQALQEAALYHDLGKVLIPDNILNKNGALNEKEWEIMQLHTEYGYELAKNKNLSPKTVSLIRYHHQNEAGTGYSKAGEDFEYDINNEILAAADKYCALKEKRSYKEGLSDEEALKIIKDEVRPEVYEALVKAIA